MASMFFLAPTHPASIVCVVAPPSYLSKLAAAEDGSQHHDPFLRLVLCLAREMELHMRASSLGAQQCAVHNKALERRVRRHTKGLTDFDQRH